MACAFNRTRGAMLATRLAIADTFFTRLRGLLGTHREHFGSGAGLWIYPSKGVHALGMRYAIDAVYVDRHGRVIHCECDLAPGRLGAIRKAATGVLELPAGTIRATQTQAGDVIWFAVNGVAPPTGAARTAATAESGCRPRRWLCPRP